MDLLKTLYKIQSPSGKETVMINFLTDWLNANKSDSTTIETDKHGNLYVTKGVSETYPVVVSHMDQVQKQESIEVYVTEQAIFGFDPKLNSQAGLGADDKNGIWIALKCFLQFDVIKLVFFVSEEIGCVGSKQCNINFFSNARFVIQCDRKGNADFVSTACGVKLCTPEFVNDANLANFAYTECVTGGLTDVKTLRDLGLSVCSCNISCGYYAPHTDHEITVINNLQNCCNLAMNMIQTMTKVYTFPKPVLTATIPPESNYFWGQYYNPYYQSEIPFYPDNVGIDPDLDRREELMLAEISIREEILNFVNADSSQFYSSNKEFFPSLKLSDICRIFEKIKHELS